jgi:integrase
MASIRAYETSRGDKRFEVRWRDARGRSRSKAFNRAASARRFKVDLESRLQLGTLYEARPEPFASFLDGWLRRYERTVRPSTFARAKASLIHWSGLASLNVPQIRVGDVEDRVAAIAGSAPRQAQIALGTLKQVLRDARRRGQQVDEAILSLQLPHVEEREPVFLTWAEVEELAAWCSEARMIVFAALTGLRQGELFGLRDTRVRLDEGSVFVDAGAYRGRLAPTKTRKGRRRIYLSNLAAAVLAEQLRARRVSQQGLVFPSPTGVVWRADNFRNRVFYPARRRAGLDRLTFHDLRHTCASLMIAAGANPLEVAEQLGHIDAQLVFKRYGHLYPGASRRAVLRLDSVTGAALDVGQVWGASSGEKDAHDDSPGIEEWSVPGSNRRPPACKAGALPAELTPRIRMVEPKAASRIYQSCYLLLEGLTGLPVTTGPRKLSFVT